MAQTLTILPAITSPVKVTQAKTFSANLAAIANLSNREVLALSVVALIYALQAEGGTDYRLAAGHKQLRIDATSFMGAFTLESFPSGAFLTQRMQAVLDWNAGYTAATALGTDVNALRALMGGLAETPESTLTMFRFFLFYKLSV